MPSTALDGPTPVLVLATVEAAAEAAADHLTALLTSAVAARGRAALARRPLPWAALHVFQVDERIAPDGDPARNAVQLQQCLLATAPLPSTNVHLLPVWPLPPVTGTPPADPADLAALDAATSLHRLFPDGLDAVHLGLGDDGHTASLVPDDPVLDVTDRAVAATADYRGHRRLTLTYPELRQARALLWFVTGAAKLPVLPRLLAHDPTIPAGRLVRSHDLVVADRAAVAPE